MVINMSNRYAIIENELVTNVALADAEYAQSQGWTSCPDEVGPGWGYTSGVFTPPKPYEPSAEENKATAVALLQQTDWVNEPDVINTSLNPHLLNQGDFLVYRSQLRAIAVNPTAGNLDWPVKPQEQWS